MTKIGGGALAGAGCVGAFMVMVACSSSQTSSSSGGTSGTSADPTEGGTPTQDGGGADALAGAKGGGQINLYSSKTSSTFIAAFVPPTDAGSGITPGCTIEAIGACNLLACSSTPEAGASGPPPPAMQVGTITATGGLIQGAGITLTPTGNAYEAKAGVGNLWIGGETLTFSATGGSGVAPFTVTAPAVTAGLSIASPIVTGGSSLNIPRSADFVVQWGVGSIPPVGKVSVLLSSGIASGSPKSLSCSFDVSALSGTIPTATLKRLDPGTAALTFGVSSTTTQTVSDVLVSVVLTTPPTASGEELGFVNAFVEE